MSPILTHPAPVVVDCALGSCIYITDDNQTRDFTARAGGVTGTNYFPKVVEAALEQCGKAVHDHYTAVMHKPLGEITEKLGEVLYAGLDPVFYPNSGLEAVESSIRLASMATGRPKTVVLRGGITAHGATGREVMARLEHFETAVAAVTGANCAGYGVQPS